MPSAAPKVAKPTAVGWTVDRARELEGTYFNSDVNASYELRMESGILQGRVHGKPLRSFTPVSPTSFRSSDMEILFEGDSVRLNFGRDRNLLFVKAH